MSAEQREWAEKNFRRSGDPLRVMICRKDDPEAADMVRMANRMGQIPYEQKNWICVDVLNHGLIWRAKDAVFARVTDGLYNFTTDEKDNTYCEGPY